MAAAASTPTVRGIIDPTAPPPTYSGLVTFGGIVSGVSVDSEPGVYNMIFGKRAFFGYVAAPNGEVWWFANVPWPVEPARGELASVDTAGWQRQLVDLFAMDIGPAARLISATTHDLVASPIHAIPHLPTWHTQRMIVIGDAAHAPSPSSGQGASLAIEDAVVLARCLRDLGHTEQAFRSYEAPASTQASDISGFDAMVTSLSFRPLHDVLVADDFSNANAGALPNTPPNPRTYQRGYVDGEYMVRIENAEEVANVATKDEYTDATIAVDAHTADDTPQAQVWLYCRRSGNPPSGYRFRIEPATQRFSVDRVDKAQATILVSLRSADVINAGSDMNHLELTCAGSIITGSINGQPVFSLRDTTYTQGTFNIGASGPPSDAGEIRFANFTVLQA